MRPRPHSLRHQRPWLVAGGVLLASAVLVGALLLQWHLRQIEIGRSTAKALALEQAQAIESRIARLMSSAYLLAAMVRKDGGQVRDFDAVATEMLPFFPGVASLALSPGGVIRHAVPLEPNRGSIGFDQLADANQSPEAFLARDTGKLTLAGPMALAQGGTGAVGRLPIFLADDNGQPVFWGFANVVIRFPEALEATGLNALTDLDYDFELWRIRPDDRQRQTIARSPGLDPPLANAIDVPIRVPNAEWTLSIVPRAGWTPLGALLPSAALGLLICLLLAYLAKLLLELRQHRAILQDQVEQRTAEILDVKNRLQATLDAIPDLLFEMDLEGRFHAVHAQERDLLAAPADTLQGRSISDVLPPEVSQMAFEAMREARAKGISKGHQYALDLPQGRRHFELSIATKPGSNGRHFVMVARDITDRKQAMVDLQLAAQVFQQSHEAYVITNARQEILQVNPAFVRITGYTAEEAIGQTPKLLSSGRQHPEFYREMWHQLEHTGHWEGEIWNRRKNGEIYPEWLSITRVSNDEGTTTHFISNFSDWSQRKSQEDKIRNLAYYDSLTGLANASLVKDRAEHDLQQARRSGKPLALLFIDLDHFKNINDSLGHRAGDSLLVQVGMRLTEFLRQQDTAGRISGDEFAVVMPGTDADGAAHIAQSLLQHLSLPYVVGETELHITPSIGIALYPGDGENFESLHRCADTAMYRAKKDGRNGFCFFTADMQAQSMRHLQLENALRRAMEREELSLHYQPQVSLATGRVVGVEVLLRWNHHELGPISPAEFIPVAENSGLILPIGEWVLRTATRQMKAWLDRGYPAMLLAVNLSAVQFRQAHLPGLVRQILEESGLPDGTLELELTESVAMGNAQKAIEMMEALHRSGTLMSVDDFGTGYSSLSYLKRFNAYKLKIDQSFVRDIPNDPEDASIVTAIIQMAHSLGMVTIAEGVETQAQHDFLRQRGCDEIQGYLISRPLPAKDFEAFMEQRPSLG